MRYDVLSSIASLLDIERVCANQDNHRLIQLQVHLFREGGRRGGGVVCSDKLGAEIWLINTTRQADSDITPVSFLDANPFGFFL